MFPPERGHSYLWESVLCINDEQTRLAAAALWVDNLSTMQRWRREKPRRTVSNDNQLLLNVGSPGGLRRLALRVGCIHDSTS